LQREVTRSAPAGSASEALVALESDDWDLVITTSACPACPGLELLDQIAAFNIEDTVNLITRTARPSPLSRP